MMTQKNANGPVLKNKKGYMLLEALIAIGIFAIGFMAVSTLVFSAARNNTNGNVLTQANMFAREKMEELKSKTDLTELDTVEAPETVGGMFTRSWTASDPLAFGTSRQIQVIVSWTRKGKNEQVVMVAIISLFIPSRMLPLMSSRLPSPALNIWRRIYAWPASIRLEVRVPKSKNLRPIKSSLALIAVIHRSERKAADFPMVM